jgi:hypothetical protein
MPELCRRLTEATGRVHVPDATMRDYPVFVSAKSGDPRRVEKLVASALHAEWREEDGKLRLVAVKPVDEPDRAEFERLYRKACGDDKVRNALPIKDLYRMPVGQIYRYGGQATETVRKLEGIGEGLAVRRLAAGVFEFGGNDQLMLKGLSEAVERKLGADLKKVALDGEARATLRKRVSDPQSSKFSFTDFERRDPVAELCEPMLKPIAEAVTADMAFVLPDFSMFPVMEAAAGDGSVGAVLSSYSELLDVALVDEAVVGRLTMTERLYSTQTRRAVLKDLVKSAGADGVASIDTLGRYVANQRPGASDGWCDAGLLVWAGVVLDQEYVGQYPFNLRLYAQLNSADWRLLRTGEAFPASGLSPLAQRALRNLLVLSRESLGGKTDPGFWPSVRPERLAVKAELKESPVLIGWTSMAAEVYDTKMSALQYDRRKKKLGREPLYRPALRRSLKLNISLAGTPLPPVETGFSEIVPDANQKAVTWDKLPAEIAKEFGGTLEDVRKSKAEEVTGGNPPPPKV